MKESRSAAGKILYKDYGYRVDCYHGPDWIGVISACEPVLFHYAGMIKPDKHFPSVEACREWLERGPWNR